MFKVEYVRYDHMIITVNILVFKRNDLKLSKKIDFISGINVQFLCHKAQLPHI